MSVLVLVAIAAVAWAAVDVVRRLVRSSASRPTGSPSSRPTSGPPLPSPPPFGGLPPIGPVGALGEVAPDADIGSSATDEHDLYGE